MSFRFVVTKRYASTSASKQQLDEFFTYYKTHASLRPWIYRPKNSNLLLTMDLKDPNTNLPIQPRQPFKPLAKNVLNKYIDSLEPKSSELLTWFKDWTKMSVRKKPVWNYISASHLQKMLITSFFKLEGYSHLVSAIYSSRNKFVSAQNPQAYDVDHFFNTLIMCNLRRNLLMDFNDANVSKRKLIIAWGFTTLRTDNYGLAKLLVQELGKQQGYDTIEFVEKFKLLSEVMLPSIDIGTAQTDALENFIEKQNGTYIITRTLLDYNKDIDPKVHRFVQLYQSIQIKLKLTDVYDEYKLSEKEIWKKQDPKAKKSVTD